MKPILATTYANQDPRGWLMSEKLDGVRATWAGRQFLSRNGHPFLAPDWFRDTMPALPLDGELWIGRGAFQTTISRIKKTGSDWTGIKYRVFDAPAASWGGFADRLELATLACTGNPLAEIVPHRECTGRADLDAYFEHLISEGAEGIMLRDPRGMYEAGKRSAGLMKYKPFEDSEGIVIGTEPGTGQFAGQVGTLLLQWGKFIVKVGSGLTNALRIDPPAMGSLVTFRFCGLTDSGAPRFPTFQNFRNFEP